jgi:hypothetical protein
MVATLDGQARGTPHAGELEMDIANTEGRAIGAPVAGSPPEVVPVAGTHSSFLGARLTPELIKRIDEYAKRVSDETGFPITRSDVVRLAVAKGLDVLEAAQGRSPK